MSVHSVDTLAVHIPVLLLLLVTLLTTHHDYYYTITTVARTATNRVLCTLDTVHVH